MTTFNSLLLRGMRGFFAVNDAEIIKAVDDGLASGWLKSFVLEDAAFCILAMPKSSFDIPQVLHFYSEKPALRAKLASQVLDFVMKSGYTKLRAVNGSGVDDEIWKRAFRVKGWEIKPVKTVFEFEVVE